MKFLFLILFFVQGVSADTPSFLPIIKKYSYDELESAADYLAAKVESGSKTKILSCDAPLNKVNRWLSGPMRELLDEKRKEEITQFSKDSQNYLSKVRGCGDRCTCNAYSLMLSDLSEQSETAAYKELDKLVTEESKKMSSASSRSCAKKLNWYCKSDLRKYLMKF